MPMKDWRVLVSLEYEYRAFRFYRRFMHLLVKRGVRLTSPILCYVSRRLEAHAILIPGLTDLYEHETGKTVVFYRCN